MALIDVDIEEYMDEISTEGLVEEIKKRAKRENKPLRVLFSDNSLSGSIKEDVCDILGLNYLASNEDIVIELLNKLR